MAKTKSSKKPATKPAKAAAPVKAAPTVNGVTPEAKKPGKATITKPANVKKAKAVPDFVIAQINAARAALKKGRVAVSLTGPFRLTEVARKAGDADKLNLQKGSARHALMQLAFTSGKQITREQADKHLGDKASQALSGMVRYGFLQ